MHPFLGASSFLTIDQLYTYRAIAGMDSAEMSPRTDTRTGDKVQEKEQSRTPNKTETVVLLAMRPTCARGEYQASLTEQGFRTITVDDAEQGLRVLQETIPSLIVVEPELEGGGGDRLLENIQHEMSCHQIPVLVVSATANRSAIFRIAKFDIDDFAVLPISVGAFTIRVLKLLNGS